MKECTRILWSYLCPGPFKRLTNRDNTLRMQPTNQRFELVKRQFNWVELGTILRQINRHAAEAFNQLFDPRLGVDIEVVKNDKGVRLKLRQQIFANKRFEFFSIDTCRDVAVCDMSMIAECPPDWSQIQN